MSSDKPPGGVPPQTTRMPARPRLSSTHVLLIMVMAMLLGLVWFNNQGPAREEITYSFFREELDRDNIKEVEFVSGDQVYGQFKTAPKVPTTKPGAAPTRKRSSRSNCRTISPWC